VASKHEARPRSRRRTIWRAALVALAIAGVAIIAAAEAWWRLFPERLPADARLRLHLDALRDDELKSVPHEHLGYVWRPGARDGHSTVDFSFIYTIDEHGFRNSRPWPEQAEIVVLGDSQAFGFGVDDHQDWARRIDAGLPQAGVVNLALIGAAPQQLLRAYEAFGTPLRPKIVVVGLFAPNALYAGRLFADWQAAGRPDRFDLWRARGRPQEKGLRQAARERLEGWLAHSYGFLAAYHGARSLVGSPRMVPIAFDEGRVHLIPARYADVEPRARPGHPDFELVIEVLTSLRERVRADGAEMVVVLFPTKEEVLLPLVDRDPPALVAPFAAALERLGIVHLDPTPALRDLSAQGRRLFFDLDLHPNADGYRVIAEVLVEHLQQRMAMAAAHGNAVERHPGMPCLDSGCGRP
jgi:hypothetical protein